FTTTCSENEDATSTTTPIDQIFDSMISSGVTGITSRCSMVPCSRSRISAAPVSRMPSMVAMLIRALIAANQLALRLVLNIARGGGEQDGEPEDVVGRGGGRADPARGEVGVERRPRRQLARLRRGHAHAVHVGADLVGEDGLDVAGAGLRLALAGGADVEMQR